MSTTNLRAKENKHNIFIPDHARQRCEQSGVSVGFLIREISQIPNIEGEIRWRTSKGVIILKKSSTGKIVVNTFIARFKYKGLKSYH